MYYCKFFVLFITLFHTIAFAGSLPRGTGTSFSGPIILNPPPLPLVPLTIIRLPLPPPAVPIPMEEVSDAESDKIDNQRLERLAESARRLLHGEKQAFSESEKQEFQEIFNSLQRNPQWDSDISIAFHLILCELRCFGYIEKSILNTNVCIQRLLAIAKTLNGNNSAKALYILLFTLSALPDNEISNFEDVISDVFAILPKYLSPDFKVSQDLKRLIYAGYCFLKLAYQKTLPSDFMKKKVPQIINELEENSYSTPLLRVLTGILHAKLAMNSELGSEVSNIIYNDLIAERIQFNASTFIDGHIQHTLFVFILNANVDFHLSKNEFIQHISNIFSGYKFDKYDDLKNILVIIIKIFDQEQSSLFGHFAHSQHLMNFLNEKISLFTGEQRISLLQDLICININVRNFLIASVLNSNTEPLSEDELIQRITYIFTGYNFNEYHSIQRCITIIMGVINNERSTLSVNFQNSLHLVHFLEQKINQFP